VTSLRGLAVAVVLLVLVGCTATAGDERSAPASASADTGAALRTLLEAERGQYGAPGAIAVVRAGDRRWAVATGTADTSDTPLTPTATFRIASITKPVVAALVLRAVDRGQLSLDDEVATLLPGVLRDAPAVTVRMLLNHTSGIFDELNEGDAETDIARLADPALAREAARLVERHAAGERVVAPDRLLVALAETHDRYFPPGTAYHYSNTNYQLAAMVLEKVTGQSLSTLLRTAVVEPLGLRHTTVAPPDLTSPAMRGYTPATTGSSLVDATDDLLAFGNGGNGGVVSTPDELLAILRAIVSARLFPDALVTDMTTAEQGNYGLGLAAYPTRCGVFYGHGGAVNGTGSVAMVSRDGRTGVVIAQNLLGARDADLPALAREMVCTAQS
jgi:D-alanyl-D-alanine carboxypeptidase